MDFKLYVAGGASGFVGHNLCRALTERGFEVTALARDPQSLQRYSAPPWTNVASWDDDLDKQVAESDAVVNLSGVPIISLFQRWTDAYRKSVVRSRIDTTHALVESMKRAQKKPEVFVCASAVSYYPPSSTRDSKLYDENDKCQPYDFLSNLCHDWESTASEAESLGVRTVSVRTGVVLGRSGGMIANMFWPFFFGTGGPIGSGLQPFPWIHVHDLAEIYAEAIVNTALDGPINATAPADNTFGDFAREFGRAMWRPAILPLPEIAVRTIFGDERAVMFIKGQRVVPRKVLAHQQQQPQNFEFIYPNLREACQSIAHISVDREVTG